MEGEWFYAEVDRDFDGERVDVFCSRKFEVSRSSLKKAGVEIHINSKPVKKLSQRVKTGDTVSVYFPPPVEMELKPENIPIDVIYEDDYIAVINKPAGMMVHPAGDIVSGTLVNALLYRFKDKLSGIGGVERPGIVHRLDRDTYGIMVIALTDESHRKLSKMFKNRQVKKTYEAIVVGEVHPDKGIIDKPIGRHPKHRTIRAVVDDGKPALTEWKVVERANNHSRIFAFPRTGRTHQIRVHLASIGHPIVGDPLYSRSSRKYTPFISGIALCARKLEFNHPITGKHLTFEIPFPDELENLWERIKKDELF